MISEKKISIFFIACYKFRFRKNLSNHLQRWTCCKNNYCKSFFKLHASKSINHNYEQLSEFLINRKKLGTDPVTRP